MIWSNWVACLFYILKKQFQYPYELEEGKSTGNHFEAEAVVELRDEDGLD